MEISPKGLDLIKKFEGLSLKPYQCVAGVWTIGYGHTNGVSENTNAITEQQAEQLLRDDIRYFERLVNDKNYVPQSLNQDQFDALVSFAFNLGGGNLKELCNANYPPGKKTVEHIASEITLYNKANRKYCQGLANRREKEKLLFESKI